MTASVYLIVGHASSGIEAIPALTGFPPGGDDTAAPPPRAAWTGVAVKERRLHPHQQRHVSSRARGHTGQHQLRPTETHIFPDTGARAGDGNGTKSSPDSPLTSDSGPKRKLDLPSTNPNEGRA